MLGLCFTDVNVHVHEVNFSHIEICWIGNLEENLRHLIMFIVQNIRYHVFLFFTYNIHVIPVNKYDR